MTSSLPYQPNQQVQTSRLVQNIGLVHTSSHPSRLGYQVRDKRAPDDWEHLQLQHEHRHHRIADAERLVKRSEPSPRFAKIFAAEKSYFLKDKKYNVKQSKTPKNYTLPELQSLTTQNFVLKDVFFSDQPIPL